MQTTAIWQKKRPKGKLALPVSPKNTLGIKRARRKKGGEEKKNCTLGLNLYSGSPLVRSTMCPKNLAVLTRVFCTRKCMAVVARRPKKVVVLRGGLKAGFHFTVVGYFGDGFWTKKTDWGKSFILAGSRYGFFRDFFLSLRLTAGICGKSSLDWPELQGINCFWMQILKDYRTRLSKLSTSSLDILEMTL